MRRAALVVSAVLALAGCGGAKVVKDNRIPFTFTAPDGLSVEHVLKSSASPPVIVLLRKDGHNALDIRQVARFAASVERQKAVFRQISAATAQDLRVERHAGQDMVTALFDFTDRGVAVRSRLYSFVAGGRTWELECQSTEAERSKIDDACRKTVESISGSKG